MTYLKSIWNWFQSLKTWQQVVLILPIILLSAGLIFLLFSPIKPKFLKQEEIIKYSKEAIDNHLNTLEEQQKELNKKQLNNNNNIKEIEKKIKKEEKDASNTIKEIEDADDDINKLLDIHRRLNARNSK